MSSSASSSSAAGRVDFVVGNTYARIVESQAKLDRSGTYRKIHDWTLYVDVVGGDADMIERVTFDMQSDSFVPRVFTCNCPIKVRRNASEAAGVKWRFSTRQQTFGPINAEIIIRGRGGSTHRLRHMVAITPGGSESDRQIFIERRPTKPLKPIKMLDEKFGIELELTSAASDSAQDIATAIRKRAAIAVEDMTGTGMYAQASSRNDVWRLISDSSIQCHRDRPDCNRFELVSPVLRGGEGLNSVYKVLAGLQNVPSIKINKSMGFHIHVDVERLGLDQLIKFCQNYIKYEDVMDSIMPPSRRNGNAYCQSNRLAVCVQNATNKERHAKLASCRNIAELCQVMNPDGRYYKLNLTNLNSERQPTVEFRQHSATANVDKVKNWVRFCISMVYNSAKLRAPSCFKARKPLEEQFDMLFEYVIKDRHLRNFYRERKDIHANEADRCCDGCASGGQCNASSRPCKKQRRV